jgi:hypothetical protein
VYIYIHLCLRVRHLYVSNHPIGKYDRSDCNARLCVFVSTNHITVANTLCAYTYEQVATGLLEKLVEQLKPYKSALTTGYLAPLRAITQLCTNKAVASTFTKLKAFALPREGSAEAAPRIAVVQQPPQRMPNGMILPGGPQRVLINPRTGPAVENDTVLGMLLRLTLDANDEEVRAQFAGKLQTSEQVSLMIT